MKYYKTRKEAEDNRISGECIFFDAINGYYIIEKEQNFWGDEE